MKVTRINKTIIIEDTSAEAHPVNLQRKTDLKYLALYLETSSKLHRKMKPTFLPSQRRMTNSAQKTKSYPFPL